MNREEILEKTKQVIYDCMPELSGVALDEKSVVNRDMGMDSMNFILVVCKLEALFDVKIPERLWGRLSTLGDVVDAFDRRINKK